MKGQYTMEEVKRISIIESAIAKRRTQKDAALALGLSERQIRKIIKRYREEGPEGIKHKNKLHKPANAIREEVKKR